jgi:hypothetical protein
MQQEGPRGAPVKKELPEAYKELLENLYYAQHEFHGRGDAGREGVRIACQAVVRFLAVGHINPELAAPFLAVRAALEDLENSITHELFDLDSNESRRSRSGQKKHLQAVASVCLEALVGLGDPLEQAASLVARHVGSWPGRGSQIISAKTVQNWRDQQRAGSPAERTPFETMLKDLQTRPGPRKAVMDLLLGGVPGIPKS